MSRPAAALLYAAALAAGLGVMFRPTLESGFGRLQSDAGDTLLNHYILEHSWNVLTNWAYHGSLYTAPFWHPTPLTIAYSETLLGSAPLYWALRVGLPPDLAYQWWMVLLTAADFAAFAAVCRWVGCGHAAAALGAFIWVFPKIHIDHLGHEQMIARFWVPLGVYHAWVLVGTPNLRSLNRMTACVFLQAMACFYTGWFLAYGLLVFVPVAAAIRPGGLRGLVRLVRETHWKAAAVVALWAAGLLLFYSPYLIVHRGYGRAFIEIAHHIPTPIGWTWYFPGWAALVLTAGAAGHVARRCFKREWSADTGLMAACLVTAVVWAALACRYDDLSPWRAVRLLPGGGAIRCVYRVFLIVNPLAVLAGVLWFDRAARRLPWVGLRAVAYAVVWALAVYGIAALDPRSIPKDEFYPWVDRRAAVLRDAGAGAAFVLPRKDGIEIYDEVFAMWIGLRANVPVLNGYSGRRPDPYHVNRLHPDDDLRRLLAGKYRGRVAVLDPHDDGPVRYVEIE